MPGYGQGERLNRMRAFLDGLINASAELRTALETVHINADSIVEGQRLYDAAEKAIIEQNKMEAKLSSVRRQRRTIRQARSALYRKQFNRAKEDITEPSIRDLLSLDAEPATHIHKLHLEMRQFYTVALEHTEIHAQLASTGLQPQALQDGLDSLDQIEQLNALEATTNVASKLATQAQTAALKAMETWYSGRMEEATFATRHKPELMIALGRKVKLAE